MPKVGYRFYPTEQEILEYYLYNKITQNPLLYEDGDIPVRDCDLYGSDEPSVIWNLYGGNHLQKGQALYFFTRLKKLSPKATRFNRKVASGAWQGEDGSKPVLASGSDQILGFRKRFRYENNENPKEDGGWIMNEFTINSSLLGLQHSHQALDFVLCLIKKNESGQQTEKANLGKKQRNSSGERSCGNKRKNKETATPNSNDDHNDESVINKRLRAGQEVVLVPQNHSPCSSNTMLALEYEGEIVESLLEDSTTFDVEGFLSSHGKIIEHDGTEYQDDEDFQNKQPRAEEEAQAIDLPCSNNIEQITESGGEMESLPEDSHAFDVEDFFSGLDQIFGHEGADCHEDEGIHSQQLRGAEGGAPLVQQNQTTDLPSSNSIIQIMESEGEMELFDW